MSNEGNHFGKIIQHRRVMMGLTLRQLSSSSGVSASHLARIEGGGRFPSARTLRMLAKPLGFGEIEVFTLAGYLPEHPTKVGRETPFMNLDPYVARVLSEEPVKVQRAVISILNILKSITKK